MAQKPTPVALLQAAVNAAHQHPHVSAAALALGISRNTLDSRLQQARRRGVEPSATNPATLDPQVEIRRLKREVEKAQVESADAQAVKRLIGSIADQTSTMAPPTWLTPSRNIASSPGVPTLFLSDFHWGEVVHPGQINGVNQYNTRIAHERLRSCINSSVNLLRLLSPELDYPGIVVPLGGDMVSGDIHEELAESNEMHTIPTVLDMCSQLASGIEHLADTFGRVFLPCVTGNHGRNTKKIRAKDRHHTSFDWLLYQLLARHFEKDKRITFYIPDSSDAYFRVYGTRYLLSHGDQFRGGDGMIGALGPIIRGDHKKRSRNSQIDMSYDVMLIGHFHQYTHLTRLIVNGSLKGYDEYAYVNNFGFETPQQALWLTHPRHGITYRMPVYCDRKQKTPKTDWVAVPSG